MPLPASLTNLGQPSATSAEREASRPAGTHTGANDENDDITSIRRNAEAAKSAEAAQKQAAIERMQAKLRALDKRSKGPGAGDDESEDDDDNDEGGEEGTRKAKKARSSGPSFLDQELAKYASGRRQGKRGKSGSGKRDEDDLMAALSSFTGKLKNKANKSTSSAAVDHSGTSPSDGTDDQSRERRESDDAAALHLGDDEDIQGIELDDDIGFLGHTLKVSKDGDDIESRRAESDYMVSACNNFRSFPLLKKDNGCPSTFADDLMFLCLLKPVLFCLGRSCLEP